MTQLATLLALAGPLALLACLLFPSQKTALLKSIGAQLPWVVLTSALIATLVTAFSGQALQMTIGSGEGIFGSLTLVYLDAMSLTMLLLVSFLGAIVARFAQNYMAGEPREGHFYKWLCATLGSILFVIISGNLAILTVAWISTSLSLHQLLTFYKNRPLALLAAKKKFIISRLGDLCLIVAAVITTQTFGTLNLPELFDLAALVAANHLEVSTAGLHAIALLLALGALMKSAQFPFHTWLPDTLETPTPVSALMHAGIINAGGFLIVRFSPLVVLSTPSLNLLVLIGGFTAVFAGLIMLTQTSVKKALAFSTVAQMGFMMLQCGLGAFALAILHIVAHSLYKAYTFLGSGQLSAKRIPFRSPNVGIIIGAIVFGMVAFVLVNNVLGGLSFDSAYVWLLSLVTVVGLAHFLQISIGSAGALHHLSSIRAALIVVGLSGIYGILHVGSKVLLGSSVASAPEAVSGFQILLYSGIGTLFALGFALPLIGRRYPHTQTVRSLYLHASHGFYCNTLLNRMVQTHVAPAYKAPGLKPYAASSATLSIDKELIDKACSRIAPLWPLEHFVAVNPYLGYSEEDFDAAAYDLDRTVHASVLPELTDFEEALSKEGSIQDQHIEQALAHASPAVHTALQNGGVTPNAKAVRVATSDTAHMKEPNENGLTFAGFIDHSSTGYWERFISEDLSRRCAAFFDVTQAPWTLPYQEKTLYAAWRTSIPFDNNLDMAGIAGFRDAAVDLPETAEEAIAWALHTLEVPTELTEEFLHAELFSLRGWAGYCQYLRHDARLIESDDHNIIDLLAIRLVYDAFLYQATATDLVKTDWRHLLNAKLKSSTETMPVRLALRSILQDAKERSRRAPLFQQITSTAKAAASAPMAKSRPELQAVFCIDVRSEVYRRALEAESTEIETIGFAGFFGIALSYQTDESSKASARCPVLLAPGVAVNSTCPSIANPDQQAQAWKAFQKEAPACFPFVETVGLSYSTKTLQASFPSLPETKTVDNSPAPTTSIDLETRTTIAATILTHLGMKTGFGKHILFAGHGSTTANNPHASGLDCGACGGHAGDINARIAATILNDSDVREKLATDKGIHIPADTRFLAGLHDTTTDALTFFDVDVAQTAKIQKWLTGASATARLYRAPLLGIEKTDTIDSNVRKRAYDWSQTRPEWGLAGNYAFIAAPRERTQKLNLEGRAFLHNYDAATDTDGATLALILVAPVVVASWINLQYYGSTVDNAHYGAGTKTVHNIAAGIGVLSGNGGDLQTGFPIQSLHAPDKAIHEALRLHVCIEASTEAIDAVLKAHQSIRDLVENRWLHLFAIIDNGQTIVQRLPGGQWEDTTDVIASNS